MQLDSFGMGFTVGVIAAGGLFMGAWALAALREVRQKLASPKDPTQPESTTDNPEFLPSTQRPQ